MNRERWAKLMGAWDLDEHWDTFAELEKRHGEKHRFYHTGEHVEACLGYLDSVWDELERPLEVEMAFWFHDAVYNPMSAKNEEESAQWARDFLMELGQSDEVFERVYSLIMATCHTVGELSGDAALMVDIDLSILGADAERYDWYEQAIRKEYRWVPWFLYKKKRKEILQSFLDREAIYVTAHFKGLWEEQARTNLARAIGAL
jgi:predicted metal-dependent HD superfamily phosphohydrolase